MYSPLYPHVLMIGLTGIVSLVLAIYVFIMRKKLNGGSLFILLSGCIAVYAIGHVFEMLSERLPEMTFWIRVQYAALPFISPLILIQIIRHFGLFQSLNRKAYKLLFVVPFLTVLVNWTNDFHYLFYHSTGMDQTYIVSLFLFTPGPWYAVHAAFSTICMLVALAILIWRGLTARRIYQRPIFLFIIAILIPMAAYFMYLTGQLRYPVDPVPMFLGISVLLFFWGLFSSRLFELVPLAKERVFHSMSDGVVVIDANDRVVDYNPAAMKVLTHLEERAIGHDFRSYWCSYKLMAPEPVFQEFEWHEQIIDKYFQVLIVPLFQNNRYVGKTITLRDITTQKEMEQELMQLAYTDTLTRIANRGYLLQRAEEQLGLMIAEDRPFSCILFDIDHFKAINDTYGHAKGDSALIHIVEIVNAIIGQGMIFGRYGGEEFVICLPDTCLEKAGAFANRLRSVIETTPLEVGSTSIQLSASFGVSELNEYAYTTKTLLHAADKALYAAKDNGRNAVYMKNRDTIIKFDPREDMRGS